MQAIVRKHQERKFCLILDLQYQRKAAGKKADFSFPLKKRSKRGYHSTFLFTACHHTLVASEYIIEDNVSVHSTLQNFPHPHPLAVRYFKDQFRQNRQRNKLMISLTEAKLLNIHDHRSRKQSQPQF